MVARLSVAKDEATEFSSTNFTSELQEEILTGFAAHSLKVHEIDVQNGGGNVDLGRSNLRSENWC